MDKIRVLHLIKTLSLGGAETNLFNLVRATDPERFEIHVGFSYGGEIEQRFREGGVRLFKYAEKSHRVKSAATLGIVWRLARYIRRNRIQIVHTHNFNSHVWGTLAAKLAGAKVVEHVHDFRYLDPEEFRRRRGENAQYSYVKYLKGFSDRVIVLTRQNREYLVRNGLCAAPRIVEIQNGIPMRERTPDPSAKRALGLPENARVILTTCRMAPEKNVELILDVAPEVLKRVPNAVFVISGDGPLFEDLKARVRREGLEEGVRFIGFHPDPMKLLAFADVFLLPSFLELHSISILEAMSMAVPVVVSSGVGCNDEFLADWESGVLLDPFSAAGWASAVTRLLEDEALRVRVGRRGYETCRDRFDIRVVAKQKESVYAELARA